QATKWHIIATIGILVLQRITRIQVGPGVWWPGKVTEWLKLDTERVAAGELWRLVTYAFVHSDGTVHSGSNFIWHIVLNMWMLWLFGGYVEDIYGRWEFLTFYLAAGGRRTGVYGGIRDSRGHGVLRRRFGGRDGDDGPVR